MYNDIEQYITKDNKPKVGQTFVCTVSNDDEVRIEEDVLGFKVGDKCWKECLKVAEKIGVKKQGEL